MTSGRIFVLFILLVGGIGTAVNGADFYIRLLYLGALLLLLAWLLTALSLRGISVERRARSHRAAVGDVFEENFEISNNSRITKFWLEVYNQTRYSSCGWLAYTDAPARTPKAFVYCPYLADTTRRVYSLVRRL